MKGRASLLIGVTLVLASAGFIGWLVWTGLGPSFRDDFGSPRLSRGWFWLAGEPPNWSLSTRPGWLRLATDGETAGQPDNDRDRRAFLCRNLPPGDFTAETCLEPDLHGIDIGRPQAGISVLWPSRVFVKLVRTGGVVQFSSNVSGSIESRQIWLKHGGRMWLRITATGSQLHGYYSTDGRQWFRIHDAFGLPPHVRQGTARLSAGVYHVERFQERRFAEFDYFVLQHGHGHAPENTIIQRPEDSREPQTAAASSHGGAHQTGPVPFPVGVELLPLAAASEHPGHIGFRLKDALNAGSAIPVAVDLPRTRYGLRLKFDREVPSLWDFQLNYIFPHAVVPGQRMRLSFCARSLVPGNGAEDRRLRVTVGFVRQSNPTHETHFTESVRIATDWREYAYVFTTKEEINEPVRTIVINNSHAPGSCIEVAGLSLVRLPDTGSERRGWHTGAVPRDSMPAYSGTGGGGSTPAAAPRVIIVDDSDQGYVDFLPPGGWTFSPNTADSYKNSSRLARIDGIPKMATFYADIPADGVYNLEICFEPSTEYYRSKRVPTTVGASDGHYNGALNQTGGGPGFRPVGRYSFKAGRRQPIMAIGTPAKAEGPNAHVSVDAIRLTRVAP